MDNPEREQVRLDECAEELFDADQLRSIDQKVDATEGGKTFYLGDGQQHIIVSVVRGRVHLHIRGTLSRRRAAMVLLGLTAGLLPLLDNVVQFVGTLLRHATGP